MLTFDLTVLTFLLTEVMLFEVMLFEVFRRTEIHAAAVPRVFSLVVSS
jgi:hypothetical protein